MEFLVLKSYLKFKKENQETFWEFLKKQKFSHNIVFFTGMMAALIALLLLIPFFIHKQSIFIWYCLLFLLLEIGCCIILLMSGNKTSIENSDLTLTEKDAYYKSVLKWLISINYSKKNQIKQLCNRCEKVIEKNKTEQEKSSKFIDTLFTILIAPALLAIISWTLDFNGEFGDHFVIIIGLLGIVCVLYFGAKCIINEVQTHLNHTYTDMQRMVNDLHGVLDRCFKITDKDLI